MFTHRVPAPPPPPPPPSRRVISRLYTPPVPVPVPAPINNHDRPSPIMRLWTPRVALPARPNPLEDPLLPGATRQRGAPPEHLVQTFVTPALQAANNIPVQRGPISHLLHPRRQRDGPIDERVPQHQSGTQTQRRQRMPLFQGPIQQQNPPLPAQVAPPMNRIVPPTRINSDNPPRAPRPVRRYPRARTRRHQLAIATTSLARIRAALRRLVMVGRATPAAPPTALQVPAVPVAPVYERQYTPVGARSNLRGPDPRGGIIAQLVHTRRG